MKKLGKIYMALLLLFLYVPIFVLIVFSFNETKSRSVFSGFTLDWYSKLFHNRIIMDSLMNTIIIAVAASIISTILGTFAAIGINNMRKVPKSLVLNATNMPIINPEIVTGVSLMLLFVFFAARMEFEFGFVTLLIAHITFDVPYIILNIMPKFKQMDPHLYEAAVDLGCSPMSAFRKVVLPEIMPGVVSGFLMAFTYSLDDFVITHFTQGAKFNNLSTEIYSLLRRKIPPTINALSALLFLAIIIIMVLINVYERRAEKRAAQNG
jgi:spermidine/putrescine transport system permease protein